MNRLRIYTIGAGLTLLALSAIPAHGVPQVRTAKVCAKTTSELKIVGVQFTWTYPGTVGGSGRTDKLGCFTVAFLPTGEVTFTNNYFELPISGAPLQRVNYPSRSFTTLVGSAGNISLTFPSIESQTFAIAIRVADPANTLVPSHLTVTPISPDEQCSAVAFAPYTSLDQLARVSLFTDLSDTNAATLGSLPPAMFQHAYGLRSTLLWQQQPLGFAQLLGDNHARQYPRYEWPIGFLPKGSTSLRLFNSTETFTLNAQSSEVSGCLKAVAKSGSQTLETFASLSNTGPGSIIEMHYPEYLQGFRNIPKSLPAKFNKANLTITLVDDQNKSIAGTPVSVNQSNNRNPYIGKNLKNCRPKLNAITNDRGKATLTLCPTKNVTVTVSAPLLGVTSSPVLVKP